ncbi:LysM peptidoglycan-binding domain-containing protein [Winogradskyella sp. A3E31]|uniref:PBP1 and LysM peptidoglycan-binding domain-containing protein n=1 Tax=Winogradskyella sp. A3E31 TaxID=3349637 RepID=UPI00398AB177
MKHIVAIFILLFSFGLNAQEYRTHKVAPGETLQQIAKKYLVTPFDILALNPDAKTDFGQGTILIIPTASEKNKAIVEASHQIIGFKNHKVRRKETLFSISQQYGIAIDSIKRHNPKLYAETLQKGDRIKIPRYKTIVSKQTMENTIKKYAVRPKEGKWRVAYKFGITVPQLEALNPDMKEVLQPGDVLNVPNIADNEEKPLEDQFEYYEVLPKEGYYRLNIKLGLTEEQLKQLNPELEKDGLKAGMILKVPSDISVMNVLEETEIVDLGNSITDTETKKIALLLPFRLQRIDLDSVQETKAMMKNDRMLSVTLDFHSGALMALDAAKKLGVSSELSVFDTENRVSEISNLVSRNDFTKYDAIIGPMTTGNFDRFAQRLRNEDVPLIAPMAIPSQVYDNVYQTIPDSEVLQNKMIDFVKADSVKQKVIIVADRSASASVELLKRHFPTAFLLYSRKTEKGADAKYVLVSDLENLFVEGKNVVFLETTSDAFASNVISLLNGLNMGDKKIVLSTLNRNKAFEGKDVENTHLSNLSFQYPSINKGFNEEQLDEFITKYESKYGVKPNRFAIRGYDVMLDTLLRLASEEGNLYEASGSGAETEYIENKFRYNKKLFGGYVNEAAYIVHYNDLRILPIQQ